MPLTNWQRNLGQKPPGIDLLQVILNSQIAQKIWQPACSMIRHINPEEVLQKSSLYIYTNLLIHVSRKTLVTSNVRCYHNGLYQGSTMAHSVAFLFEHLIFTVFHSLANWFSDQDMVLKSRNWSKIHKFFPADSPHPEIQMVKLSDKWNSAPDILCDDSASVCSPKMAELDFLPTTVLEGVLHNIKIDLSKKLPCE